jgi:gag-polyprotein putative aspartyl protease
VPFYRTGAKVVEIDVQINGLPSRFTFDPGASMVSFGRSYYQKLANASLISDAEIKYKTKTKLADGTLSDVTIVNLKRILLGQFELNGIEAMVVEADNAPCLIGQSIIQNFSTVTIDNVNQRLVLTATTNSSLLQLDNLKFIPCSNMVVAEVENVMEHIRKDKTAQIRNFALEDKIPSINAINRIKNKITIRYFDRNDMTKSESLRNKFGVMGYSDNQVFVEDMTPYFSQPIPNYIEIWIK